MVLNVSANTVNTVVHNPVKKRVALLWTIEEESLLAHKEAALIIEGVEGTEITRILSEGSTRSHESIRKRRCLAAYKAMVQAKLRDLTEEPPSETVVEISLEAQEEIIEETQEAHSAESHETQTPRVELSEDDQAERDVQTLVYSGWPIPTEEPMGPYKKDGDQ